MVISDREAASRQQIYLDALRAQSGSSLDLAMGRYQQKQMTCRRCGIGWTSYEEKETDVNIAVALVTDAALGEHDLSLILSADSDLCPAIRAVRDVSPELGRSYRRGQDHGRGTPVALSAQVSPQPDVRKQTPHWLVFVLPQRALVEQTVRSIDGWLSDVASDLLRYTLMGGVDL